MTSISKITLVGLASVFLTGCAHLPGGLAPSTTPIEGRAYDVLGDVKGTDSRTLLLGILPISGANTIQGAVDNAKEKMGADALIEVSAEAYSSWWLLWSNNNTIVRGKAIMFK
jgi:hypothetical protein